MAAKIIFPVIIDDKKCIVDISQPFGAGGSDGPIYHLYIDNYSHGQLFKRSYGWDYGLAPKSFITIDDLDVIFDIIDSEANTFDKRQTR